MDSLGSGIRKPSLYNQSDWLARIFSTWTLVYFLKHRLSWRHLFASHDPPRDIELEDLHRCAREDESRVLLNSFKAHMHATRHDKLGPGYFFWSWIVPKDNIFLITLLRMFSPEMIVPLVLTLIQECFIKVVQPILIGAIIAHFRDFALDDPRRRMDSTYDCLGLIIILCATSLATIGLLHPSWLLAMKLSLRLKIVWSSLVYDKCLRLNQSSETGLPQLVTLLTTDIQRFDEFALLCQFLVAVPIQTAVLLHLSWLYMGPACLSTFVSFSALSYILSYISRRSAKLRSASIAYTQKRLALLGEVFRHLRALKIYTLESKFLAKIFKAREEELQHRAVPLVIQAASLSFSFISSRVIFYLIFVFSVSLLGERKLFHLESMFVLVAFFERLRYSLTWTFPQAISGLQDVLGACDRINRFLEQDEHQSKVKMITDKKCKPSVVVSHLYTRSNGFELQDISFQVSQGQVMSIVGPVGCGKSSLLLALLSEVNIDRAEQLEICGSIAYVGQECYCLPGSIRDNIVFGEAWDEGKYAKTLACCALQQDLAALPLGDRTLVGEHGSTLSGGQKARISLARALYADKDIYLLDDPLSAVDVHLSDHIQNTYIHQALASKVVLLATHQLHSLHQSDCILCLDHGKQIALGEFKTLSASSGELSHISVKPVQNEKCETMPSTRMQKYHANGNLLKQVDKIPGNFSLLREYWSYIRLGSDGRLASLALVLVTALAPQFLTHLCDHWLTLWESCSDSPVWFIFVYTCIVASLLVFAIVRAQVFFRFCHRASAQCHNTAIESIVRAPLASVEYIPTARLIGHFARDVGVLDDSMPFTWFELNLALSQAVAIVLMIIFISPHMLLITCSFFYLLVILRQRFAQPSLCLRRLDTKLRNVVFDHLGCTFSGLVTIRAYGRERIYQDTFARLVDDHTAVAFTQIASVRVFCTIIDLIAFSYISLIMFMVLAVFDGTNTPLVAICFSSIFSLVGVVQWACKRTIDSDHLFMSYLNLKQFAQLSWEEDGGKMEEGNDVDEEANPIISMANVSVFYGKSPQHRALNSIRLTITPGQKIGVCGRSGAGKTSLVSTLLRLVHYQGKIVLAGRDLRDWPLQRLRSSLSIIPQTPIIFDASLRDNLDLLGRHSEKELWAVLDKVHLRELVETFEGQLDEPLGPDTEVMSLGQKQLVCVARILLDSTRLVILDEPTANIDHHTDQLIQHTIRREFQGPEWTVVMIAHRLESIIDCERIMVFDEGNLVEDGTPSGLLANESGHFHRMVTLTGETMAHTLKQRARKAIKVIE